MKVFGIAHDKPPSKCPWVTLVVKIILFGEILNGYLTERIYNENFYLHGPVQIFSILFGLLADAIVPRWIVIVSYGTLMSVVGFFELLIKHGVILREGKNPDYIMVLIEIGLATEAVRLCFVAEQMNPIHFKAHSRHFFVTLFWFRNMGRIIFSVLDKYSLYSGTDVVVEEFNFVCSVGYLAGTLVLLKFISKGAPSRRLVFDTFACFFRAVIIALRRAKKEKTSHWLYQAQDKYPKRVILQSKAAIDVIIFVLPVAAVICIFYLTLMITRLQNLEMKSQFINNYITVVPVVFIQRITIAVVLPIIELIIYPFIQKKVKVTDTRIMLTAVIIVILAITAAVAISVTIGAKHDARPKKGFGQVKIFNALPNEVKLRNNWPLSNEFTIPGFGYFSIKKLEGSGKIVKTIFLLEKIGPRVIKNLHEVKAMERKSKSFVLTDVGFIEVYGDDPVHETAALAINGHVDIFILCGLPHCDGHLLFKCTGGWSYNFSVPETPDHRQNIEIEPCNYTIAFKRGHDKEIEKQIHMGQKGVYAIVLSQTKSSEDTITPVLHTVIEPHIIYWYCLIPQITLLGIGEILLATSLQNFIFTQSPPCLRSFNMSFFVSAMYAMTGFALLFVSSFHFTSLEVIMLDNVCVFLALFLLFLNIKYKYYDWFTPGAMAVDEGEEKEEIGSNQPEGTHETEENTQ